MTTIQVGVCGWGDQHELYVQGVRNRDKLSVYASHFPIVEVDSSFYAILPQRNYESWVKDTPERFGFIVKPHQGMTGHQRGDASGSRRELFRQFEESIQPVVEADKLKALLFQFPPWFDCTREHVQYVTACRQAMQAYPFAVEFRHQSWFESRYSERTLDFLHKIEATHVVCDEPQVGKGSVPIVPAVTKPSLALVRFHGRNKAGWRDPGEGQNWRDVRYLYRYNETELAEWVEHIRLLERETDEVCILFNNNSGGDAAANAKQFSEMLGLAPTGLNPRQMDLFST
ncbi:DUF72 domain-containing protein [Brevibacillus sp. DP1.3A]|uniref:DUF72 domain-containing protein n=1 Tax=Brevibacillus sp. DP1.3A TaxID=2738867 RepID=UPI00156B1ED4|nr:DUF72 domain-containing protein [Brevibacillus sp. DP1.3A]UED76130.1 DUF72 domain-containing protein [Brevibacillus sp. DP1.3A]